MSLNVIGAGLGRTGTNSLKGALERLLDCRCYHMFEVFHNPHHIPTWHAAAREVLPDWPELFSGYGAAVDWPVAAFWPELMQAYPDALVILSVRDARSWWESADRTIFPDLRHSPDPKDRPNAPPFMGELRSMIRTLLAARFDGSIHDAASAMAAFEAHNAEVRRRVPPARLLEWRATDGWGPLCDRLGLPEPDEPFPHSNSTSEFLTEKFARERGPVGTSRAADTDETEGS